MLPVGAEWLAQLPHGVLVDRYGRTGERIPATEAELLAGFASVRPLGLVLTDTVTAAAVAARIVGPWLDTQPDARAGRSVTGGRSEAQAITEAARRMELLTPEQISTLARLARAAMEEG